MTAQQIAMTDYISYIRLVLVHVGEV